MLKRTLSAAAAALALIGGVTACSSSSKGANSTGAAGTEATGGTIKLGVISDLTGSAASGFLTTEKGIKAYVDMINAAGGVNGKKLSYVMADTTSLPPGALTAAQKLVQSDKVFAIINVSRAFYGAEPYLLKAGVPVVGGGFDGPEWSVSTNTNLFDSVGTVDFDGLDSATGEYMKARGVTSCGAIAYSSSLSAQKSATGEVESCAAAGLKNGYLNNQITYGSTDMAPVALKIKTAGVDGLDMPVVPNTAFALVAALKQIGVTMKSILLATGYGGDLLASPAAVTAAQGAEFSSVGQPVEANTPATRAFVKALAGAGVTNTPTFAEQEAYIAMAAFVTGLKAAGANPTRASFGTALRNVHDFDADGLLAPGKVDFSNFKQFGEGSGSAGCVFAAELQGTKFVPVKGQPFCGKRIR